MQTITTVQLLSPRSGEEWEAVREELEAGTRPGCRERPAWWVGRGSLEPGTEAVVTRHDSTLVMQGKCGLP